MTRGRVGVIGAGIAGLSAARQLVDEGFDVLVLEKSRGLGGRSSTRRDGADAFDHGAQYFTCHSPRFEAQVEEWCRRGVAAAWETSIARLANGSAERLDGETKRYVGVPGMSALARNLGAGLSVECQVRVTKIEPAVDGWTLRAESGESKGPFDAVIVAAPAPQAAALLELQPSLARLAGGAQMLPCVAAMLRFDDPLGLDFGGAFVEGSPLAWVARNASKPDHRVRCESWVLHASPEWSAAHLDEPPEVLAAELQRAFAEALGRTLPRIRSNTVHTWRFARTESPVGVPFLWDRSSRIGACGDWTLGARVEDAFTSGTRLAAAIRDAGCRS